MNVSGSSSQPSVLLMPIHPRHESLTWQITRSLADGVVSDGVTAARILDLHAEGFDPTYRVEDLEIYGGAQLTPEIRKHHELVDQANVTILIFPVYWWSMPAMLKGWIDRVFTRDWAFTRNSETNVGKVRGRFGDRGLHTLAVAADKEDVFERHGYLQAMHAQIDHGILEYCGVQPPTRHMFYRSEDPTGDAQREMISRAYQLGITVASEAGTYKAAKDGLDESDLVATVP